MSYTKGKMLMPNYKGHLVGGSVAYGLLLFGLSSITRPSLCTACEWLFFTLAGSLFPDIDIKSKGQKYFYYIIFLLLVFLTVKQQLKVLACFSFIIITPMLVRHRGVFHEFWFVMLVSLIAWILAIMVLPSLATVFFFNILFFITGAMSHIILDRGFSRVVRDLFWNNYNKRKSRWN